MPNYARRKVASYRHVQRATTTPAQRVVMCYDSVARDLENALSAFEESSPDRLVSIHNALHHALQILEELRLALDKRSQPALSESLEDLYIFWMKTLSDANAEKRPEPIREVLAMVRDMGDAWRDAAGAAASGHS